MHITRTPLSTDAPFILDDVKMHTRVSFDDDDAALAVMAWAAAREIEAHCALALMTQIITVTMTEWGRRVPLPIGPLDVAALDDHPITVQTREADGSLVTWPQDWFVDVGRFPVLHLPGRQFMDGKTLVISYAAGFGSTAASIPEDLQYAINDQASRAYDLRGAEDAAQGLSLAASRIAARHRRVAVA
ncbi:head-tail connector protein [Paracoccus yeei]|uniref:head-tail connector protein n=1 Tax=Paracoccus yeei TaxID=147645 RepID=UPI003BF91064